MTTFLDILGQDLSQGLQELQGLFGRPQGNWAQPKQALTEGDFLSYLMAPKTAQSVPWWEQVFKTSLRPTTSRPAAQVSAPAPPSAPVTPGSAVNLTGPAAWSDYTPIIQQYFGDLGPEVVQNMAQIMGLESGGNPFSHNTKGEDSRGLFQINVKPRPYLQGVDLFDPETNIRIARDVYNSQGYAAWYNAARQLGLIQ